MVRSSLAVVGSLIALATLLVPPAQASRITVYDSQGFSGANLGTINGQSAGTWHSAAGARSWSVMSGSVSDGAHVVDVGGTHGKALSFPATGNWADTRLKLDWTHWNTADSGLPISVRWDYDFYEEYTNGGHAWGEVVSHRNANQVQQVGVLALGGDLRVEARPYRRDAPWEPSHPVGGYTSGEWHRVTVLQNYRYPVGASEEQGEVRVYLDGRDVTLPFCCAHPQWFTVWNGYVGTISDLAFNQMVRPGGRFYVDNVVVRTGQWAEMTRLDEERVQVYNSEGFDRYSVGPVHGQRRGRWYRPGMDRFWEVTTGRPEDGATIVSADAFHGKALSFPGNGRWADTSLNTKWTGEYGDQATIVRTDFDFRQTAGCYGTVETLRNDGQVVQARVGLENGTLELFGRKDRPDAPIETHALASYSLASGWHSLGIEQHQPRADGHARIKVFLDNKEVTQGSVYYGQSVGWRGTIDQVRFHVGCNSGSTYHVDDLSVVEGPIVEGRPLPVNWLWFWGDDIAQQQGWANAVHTNDLGTLSDAGNARMATMFDVASLFIVSADQTTKLRHDYALAWEYLADLIEDEVASGQIFGFYLPDEALWYCIRESDLATAAREIHRRFPEAPVYINDAFGAVASGNPDCQKQPGDPPSVWSTPIPGDIDWFSIDSYGRDASDEWVRLSDIYRDHIHPRMQGRKATVVVRSFSSNAQGPETRLRRERLVMNDIGQTMVNWAMVDPRIVALDPYVWPNGSPAYEDDVGTINMPDARRVWESTGRVISDNNPRPQFARFFPTQDFDSIGLANGRRGLPSTYSPDPFHGGIDPTPPDANTAFVTNADAYSRPNAIRLVRSTGTPFTEFRYAQQINRAAHAEPVGYDRSYVDVRLKPDDASNYELELWPIRGLSAVMRVFLTPDGIGLWDGDSASTIVSGNQLSSTEWTRVTIHADRVAGQVKVWVDGALKHTGSLKPMFDVKPNTVHFRLNKGALYVDDLGFGRDQPF